MKISKRVFRFVLFVPIALLCFVSPNPVEANTYTATSEIRDFYFVSQEFSTLTIRTYAQQYGIDSMLWVYDEQNNLITANDDYFGLDSFVSFQMTPNIQYRLRTGVCCGNPDNWYGESYIIEPSLTPSNAPETTSTTTTTLAPYLNGPQNLLVTSVNESKIYLSWDAPEQSNTNVERYAIFWSCDNWVTGFAISSINTFGVVENLNSDEECSFKVRADNDTLGVYSGWSNEVLGRTLPTTTTIPPTTTTTTLSPTTTTTTSTIVETTTTTEAPSWTTTTVLTPPAIVTTTEPPVETPPSESNPESEEPASEVPQYAPEQEAPEDEAPIEFPEEVQETTDEEVASIFSTPLSDEELENAVGELLTDAESPEELTAIVNSLLEQELTDEQFSTVIDTVFSESLSNENFAAALNVVFDEPISDEKFDAVIDAVLDQPLSEEQFEALVGVLESDTVSEEQVASAVDSIIELGVTEDQATELATSAKVLQSIDGEQATEIFAAVDISAVTPEEAAQLVEAVQNAPTEVRESMESEINVFQGAIDTYVPLGSSVPISTRRVIIGASALAIFSAPLPTSRRN